MGTFMIDILTGRPIFINKTISESGGTPTSGSTYPEVNLYSNLPSASENAGKTYLVRSSSGDYTLNRKESGFYYSNGSVWRRLGDISSFFNSSNFQIYNDIDNTKSIKFDTSDISTDSIRTLKLQDIDGTIAYLKDLDDKLDISDFNNYSGSTDIELENINNDVVYLSGQTDTKLNISTFNNYTGDTAPNTYLKLNQSSPQVVSGGSPQFDALSFNINNSLVSGVGKMRWNDESGTLEFGLAGETVNLQIGQESVIRVRNRSNSNMNNGQLVSISGGTGKYPEVILSRADSVDKKCVIGMLTEDISSNGFGYVTIFGLVRDINTTGSLYGETWQEGDELFLSSTISGGLTKNEPNAPNYGVFVGVVVNVSADEGIIFVNPKMGLSVKELSDVNGTVLNSDGQFPVWDNGNKYFDFDKNINDYQIIKNNYTLVQSVEDLPTPDIDGVINLSTDWVYEIRGYVNIAPYKINLGNAGTIKGINPTRDVLVAYNEGAVINGVNAGGILKDIGLMNSHPSGELFDLVDNGQNLLGIYNCYFLDHINLGTIEGYAFILMDGFYAVDFKGTLNIVGGDGIDSSGYTSVFINRGYVLDQSTTGNTFLTINSGYFRTIKIWDGNYRISNGNVFLYHNDTAINVTDGTLERGLMGGNVFLLDLDNADITTGIDHTTGGWEFYNNSNFQDSNIIGYVAFVYNLTETNITTQSEYTKVAGTNDVSSTSERTDITQDDARIDHVCVCNPLVKFEILLVGSVVSIGTNQSVLIGVLKNGQTPAVSEQEVFLPRSDEPMTFAIGGFNDAVLGDYYEVYVANLTSTNNIRIIDMQFKILKI